MRLLPASFLLLAQVRSQIPKCEPPQLPEGTRMVCPRGRKNGDKCTSACEPGYIKTGRDITITCRCVRLKAGIKCKFNEHPAECIREGHGQVGRDGRILAPPTRQPETTKAGRQVFYPGGTPPAPKAKAPKRPSNVNIGGFEARQPSTIEKNGVSFNSNNKANVGSSLQATLARQIELLQAQQDQINSLINKPPPAKVGVPTIPFGGGSIAANFDNAYDRTASVDQASLVACGAPTKIGSYSIVDKWDSEMFSISSYRALFLVTSSFSCEIL